MLVVGCSLATKLQRNQSRRFLAYSNPLPPGPQLLGAKPSQDKTTDKNNKNIRKNQEVGKKQEFWRHWKDLERNNAGRNARKQIQGSRQLPWDGRTTAPIPWAAAVGQQFCVGLSDSPSLRLLRIQTAPKTLLQKLAGNYWSVLKLDQGRTILEPIECLLAFG